MLMSSNTIEELERVCDKVAYMSQGKIIDIADVHEIKNRKQRDLKIEFKNSKDYNSFLKGRKDILRVQPQYEQVTLRINKEDIPKLFKDLEKYDLRFISESKYNLATYFNERRKNKNAEEK